MKKLSRNEFENKVAKILSESYAKAGRNGTWTSEEADKAIQNSRLAARNLIKHAHELKVKDQKILEIAAANIPKNSFSMLPPKLAHKDDAK